jgi:hypothetical protein
LRQPAPVEGDTMAVPRRRYRHALFDGKRMLDIAVEPESVRFEMIVLKNSLVEAEGVH